MKKTEVSIVAWSIYLLLLGFGLVVVPRQLLALFGYSLAEDLWVRMLGILSFVLGGYYLLVYHYRLSLLYPWKVAGHLFGSGCMLAFLALKIADARLLGTLATELSAAAWTALALRADLKNKRR